MNTFTIEEILDLKKQGLSNRAVARTLGKESQESTVRNMLTRYEDQYGDSQIRGEMVRYARPDTEALVPKGPRVLILDIETAPILGQLWSLWQHGIGLVQVDRDWSVLSYTAKWLGEDEIFYNDLRNNSNIEDDYDLIEDMWHLFDQADFIVGHNVRKFDIRKIRARMLIQGLQPPSTFRVIDTLEMAKANFAFTSNKLEYLTDKLCTKYKKSKHGKFSGHELWKQCLLGNMEAWEEMQEYNKFDVLSNEELFEILIPWDRKLPNFDLYIDDNTDMSAWETCGYHYTNLGKYRRYRHRVTGQFRRGRTNLLSKEKRKSLLANIIA